MGDVLAGVLGMKNDFRADTGGQNIGMSIGTAQSGISNNFQNQNGLAQALAAQASGAGANPAMAMYQKAAADNIKQNSAMMASQKGINAGSTQRAVALNAANQGQQAVSQAGIMAAQQQLAAQGQLGSLYGQIGTQQQNNQNAYQGALQSSNGINAGVASENAAVAGKIVGGLISGVSGAGGMGAMGATSGAAAAPATASGAQFGGLGGNYRFAQGGRIPGQAQVPGDSEQNDTVHTLLSPGEIVIPRTKASDPAKAKQFIDHVMGESKKGDAPSFADIAKLNARIKQLEKKVRE